MTHHENFMLSVDVEYDTFYKQLYELLTYL